MINLTDQAAEKIKLHITNRKKGLGIRVGVKTSGCSGLSYILEFVDTQPDLAETQIFEHNGARVYVDSRHLPYLMGLTLDWKKEGLKEGFDFQNPNIKDECGCGESFKV